MANDLMSLVSAGRKASDNEPMPGRGRRRTHNPFDDIVTQLATTGETWVYEHVSTVVDNGNSNSQCDALENALRAAGTRLDTRSKESGAAGYKTTVRKEADGDNTQKVWVTVESRATAGADTEETATPARRRR
jgi:hypothetical protein